jgi:hypothetical protein
MAKTPPEKLAAALRANLKRRKQQSRRQPSADGPKDPENIMENPVPEPVRPPQGT